ncbi:MAG: hypothetical protein Kow0090_17790 [Myxococcota bacterium]
MYGRVAKSLLFFLICGKKLARFLTAAIWRWHFSKKPYVGFVIMKPTNILFVLFLAVFLPSFASAFEVYHPTGTMEFRLETLTGADVASLDMRGIGLEFNGGTKFTTALKGGLGYFVEPNIVLGGLTGINLVSYKETVFAFPLGGFARYLVLIAPQVEAFGEGDLGLIVTGNGRTEIRGDIGVKAGLDYLFTPYAALFGAFYLDVLIKDGAIVPLGVTYGMRAYF